MYVLEKMALLLSALLLIFALISFNRSILLSCFKIQELFTKLLN